MAVGSSVHKNMVWVCDELKVLKKEKSEINIPMPFAKELC